MANKQELDEESKSFLDLLKNIPPLDFNKTSVDELRKTSEQFSVQFRGDFVFQGKSKDKIVRTADCEIPVTVLKPNLDRTTYKYIIVYYHGGGWVLGSRNTLMCFCQMIAQKTGAVVVNVEYRLAPEHKFPAAFIDAQAVARWCRDHKVELSGNPACKVGVAGDSAGGNMSASACHDVKGLDFQVLVYPSVDLSVKDYPSYERYKEGYLLTAALMDWFQKHLLSASKDQLNPIGSPIRRSSFSNIPSALTVVAECDPIADMGKGSPILHESLEGLPDALIIIAECDSFADHGRAYHKKLTDEGIKSELLLLPGALHGFASKPGHFKQAVAKTVNKIADFLVQLEDSSAKL